MNKTVNINLGGIIFHIEDAAFDKLSAYLEKIKSHFSGGDGYEDIITDIESRIAEMFNEKLTESQQVVLIKDVDEAMKVMGMPEEFEADQDEEEPVSTTPKKKRKRRFYRNSDEKILGGVASGISAYLDIDPVWLRVVIVCSVFLGGAGAFIYLLLWIIIPEAKTAAQKLEMRGEKVTVSNIKRTTEEEIENLKNKFSEFKAKGSEKAKSASSDLASFLNRLVDLIGTIIRVVFKVIGKLFGFAIIAAAFIGLFVLGFSLLGVFNLPWSFLPLIPFVFGTNTIPILGLIGIFLIFGIPIVFIIYKATKILFDVKLKVKGLGMGFFIAWIAGVILTSMLVAQMAFYYSHDSSVSSEIYIEPMPSDTLYLKLMKVKNDLDDEGIWRDGFKNLIITEKGFLIGDIKLDVVRGMSQDFELHLVAISRGRTNKEARGYASRIKYEVEQSDSILYFNPRLRVDQPDLWRKQNIKLKLYVPLGKTVYLDHELKDIIYDIKNVTNTHDHNMVGHKWTMLQNGLTCIDCSQSTLYQEDSYNYGRFHRSYNFSNFNKIEIGHYFDIDIRQGNSYNIKIIGEEEDLENVEINVDGEYLEIDMKRSFLKFLRRHRPIQIEIIMPNLEEVDFSGATTSTISGFNMDEFKADIAGAASSDIDIITDRFFLDVSGASKVSLTGNTQLLDAEIRGASTLNAFNFIVTNANVEVTGASTLRLNVQNVLNAEVTGASDILYKGNPQVNSDVIGASSIKQVN